LAVALVIGILFGLGSALKSYCTDPQASLKDGGPWLQRRPPPHSKRFHRCAGGVNVRVSPGRGSAVPNDSSFVERKSGLRHEQRHHVQTEVSPSMTNTPSSTRIACQQLIERIRQIAGIQTADFTTAIPLAGHGGCLPFWLDSLKPESVQGAPRLQAFLTGPAYLRTSEIPLLQGRFLTEQNTTKAPYVVVIDSDFAHKFFPDEKPIGHPITAGFAAFGPCTIVGVAGYLKDAGLYDAGVPNQYQTYYSLYQDPDQWVPLNYPDASLTVRMPLDHRNACSCDQSSCVPGSERRADIQPTNDAADRCGFNV
jgi:hypothetical protein